MVMCIVSSRVSGTPGRGTPGQAYLQAGHPGTGGTKTVLFRKYIVCPPQTPKNHISRSTNNFRCVFCIQNKNILDFVIDYFQFVFKLPRDGAPRDKINFCGAPRDVPPVPGWAPRDKDTMPVKTEPSPKMVQQLERETFIRVKFSLESTR